MYFVLAIIFEMIFQTSQSREEDYKVAKRVNTQQSLLAGSKKKVEAIISIEEFHNRVKFGEQLVILDDLVLKVDKYLDEHPGGRFLIE